MQMTSRNLYFQVLFRVLLMVLIALAAGLCIAIKSHYLYVAALLFCETAVVVNLVNYLNTSNRKLGYFLESVRNEDSSLLFPASEPDQPFHELYQSLSKVNTQIQQLKIESRQQ